jgi:hypothetical protein
VYVDDQEVISDSENDLQYAICILHNTTKQFGMKIFKGELPVRIIIVIDNIALEQINTFTYPGCKISYEKGGGDIYPKISTFLQFLEQCYKTKLVQRQSLLKTCKVFAVQSGY